MALTLAQKLADQYGKRASDCFRFASEHAVLGGTDSPHAIACVAEGLHWLRAKRAAEQGDTSPKPYSEAERMVAVSGYTPEAAAYELRTRAQKVT